MGTVEVDTPHVCIDIEAYSTLMWRPPCNNQKWCHMTDSYWKMQSQYQNITVFLKYFLSIQRKKLFSVSPWCLLRAVHPSQFHVWIWPTYINANFTQSFQCCNTALWRNTSGGKTGKQTSEKKKKKKKAAKCFSVCVCQLQWGRNGWKPQTGATPMVQSWPSHFLACYSSSEWDLRWGAEEEDEGDEGEGWGVSIQIVRGRSTGVFPAGADVRVTQKLELRGHQVHHQAKACLRVKIHKTTLILCAFKEKAWLSIYCCTGICCNWLLY